MSNNGKFIVQLEEGVWIAEWDGDPGRTLDRNHAKPFDSFKAAKVALKMAREFRDFPTARIKNL
jgi:hypothetical protein